MAGLYSVVLICKTIYICTNIFSLALKFLPIEITLSQNITIYLIFTVHAANSVSELKLISSLSQTVDYQYSFHIFPRPQVSIHYLDEAQGTISIRRSQQCSCKQTQHWKQFSHKGKEVHCRNYFTEVKPLFVFTAHNKTVCFVMTYWVKDSNRCHEDCCSVVVTAATQQKCLGFEPRTPLSVSSLLLVLAQIFSGNLTYSLSSENILVYCCLSWSCTRFQKRFLISLLQQRFIIFVART